MTNLDITEKKQLASDWFRNLRDSLCDAFEGIENDYAEKHSLSPVKFERKTWDRKVEAKSESQSQSQESGGGEMSVMKGRVLEKVGVNISTVFGTFSENFRKEIPGAAENPQFFATGISVVCHPFSPLVPIAHFNTRFIVTTKSWFGGGGDLTPIFPESEETEIFHEAFKNACDKTDSSYYAKFKKQCDEYFFLKHRDEARGVGGIFYDYLNTENFNNDFNFTKNVGKAFLNVYPKIIYNKMYQNWNEQQKEQQLLKRGRYVEFNLLFDRGTRFGLMTGGNVEAILMSLPPVVKWS